MYTRYFYFNMFISAHIRLSQFAARESDFLGLAYLFKSDVKKSEINLIKLTNIKFISFCGR